MQLVRKMYAKKRKAYYEFLCECGQYTVLRKDTTAKYCRQRGCIQTSLHKHGKSHTRLYNIWSGMRDRCLNNHKSSKTYKDRGISISDIWNEFEEFEEWALANGYQEHLTIDRVDIDKDYSPENCEWVTREENCRRQSADGHGAGKKVTLTEVATGKVHRFVSIAKAGEYLTRLKSARPRTRTTALEVRLKTNNLTPYIGHIIRADKEGT